MKETLEQIDNWTLVQLVGGVAVIFPALVLLVKEIFFSKWKAKQERDLEILKAKTNDNSLLLSNLTTSLSGIYLASNEKRILYLETVWKHMLKMKAEIPPIIFMAYTILTKEEVQDLKSTTNVYAKTGIRQFNGQEYLAANHAITSEIEGYRPFIGENLWFIFSIYQGFLGRITYTFDRDLKNDSEEKITHWKDDKYFEQILETIIKPSELKQLVKPDFRAFQNVLNFIEVKALNEISEQLSGKRMTEETVKHAITLGKLASENASEMAKLNK